MQANLQDPCLILTVTRALVMGLMT